MHKFSRFPPPDSPPALMVVESLAALSCFPILKMFAALGPIQIYYVSTSNLGLKVIRILKVLGVVKSCCLIKDYLKIDTKHSKFHETYFVAFKICHSRIKEIELAVSKFFPGLSKYSKDLLVLGVKNDLIYRFAELIWLQTYTEQLAEEMNTSLERVSVISIYAALFKEFQSGSPFPKSHVPVLSQPFRNNVIRILGWCLFRSIKNWYYRIRGAIFRLAFVGKKDNNLNIKDDSAMFLFSAAMGLSDYDAKITMLDDLSWWRGSNIPGERLIYFYDRHDFKPTEEKVRLTNSLRIRSYVLDRRHVGSFPQLAIDNFVQKPFWISLREFLQVLKWSFQTLFRDELPQLFIAQSILHLSGAKRLATYFNALNVKGLVHYQQASADWYSLAAELTDGCRFGYARSFIYFLSDISITAQVFFTWGANDARAYTDTGGISKHLLIAGCPAEPPKEEVREKYLAEVNQIRKSGAKYVLALFDSSYESKNFYIFFLDWLMDDPDLGLIVKSKITAWEEIEADGLDGLVQSALETGRLKIADIRTSPTDIATLVDFSVGIGSASAIVMSALRGARVLLVDFERLDQGIAKQPTLLLHSLGPKRCIFYDFDSVKRAVLEYADNPESNPDLGNASPVLDQIDPFRDNLGGQRVGEYMKWYMDGRDQGLLRDAALSQATRKYAAKWGEDKVVRGLTTGS